jgi:penicillin-binding protein 1A
MMRGVVQRGTAAGIVRLDVPVAGKTGTTNEAKDVWFVGFTNTLVAGCYIGHDRPRPLGRGTYGGTTCGPVFQEFMTEATKKYGGGRFRVPTGGRFINIDRFTGARLPADENGTHVVAEYFRDGEEPVFGIAFDGGFAMGSNLPLVDDIAQSTGSQVITSSGGTAVVGPSADIGTVTSGGLY